MREVRWSAVPGEAVWLPLVAEAFGEKHNRLRKGVVAALIVRTAPPLLIRCFRPFHFRSHCKTTFRFPHCCSNVLAITVITVSTVVQEAPSRSSPPLPEQLNQCALATLLRTQCGCLARGTCRFRFRPAGTASARPPPSYYQFRCHAVRFPCGLSVPHSNRSHTLPSPLPPPPLPPSTVQSRLHWFSF